MSQLLTTSEVARRINRSEATVRRLAAVGELPVAMVLASRGIRLFDPAAVDAYLAAREGGRASAVQ